MTQNPSELQPLPPKRWPPFDGELYSEAWWQRVAPKLTEEGKEAVKAALTVAATKLDKNERRGFETTLKYLETPNDEQLEFLMSEPNDFDSPTAIESIDLSKILICHPETGQYIRLSKPMSYASFDESVFVGGIYISFTLFKGNVCFTSAVFTDYTIFYNVEFKNRAYFEDALFIGGVIFVGVSFAGEVNFQATRFAGAASFKQAEFTEPAIFEEATFKGVANFHAARFGKTVSFRGSTWGAVPDFVGTAFKDGMAIADLENLQAGLTEGTIAWDADPEPEPVTSTLQPTPAPITDRLQALRKMAHDADDRPRELDYFALELQSRYQGAGLIEWAKRWLIWLYWLFSDYGRGIGRPFGWLVGLWVGCALGYALLIKNAPPIALWLCLTVWALFIGATIDLWLFDRRQKSNPNSKSNWLFLWGACVGQWGWLLWSIPQYGNALSLSLVNALPALGVASEARKSSLEALYGGVECVPAVVHVIGVVEGVAAILLLFLIGLGLRNRFRL